MSGTLKSYYNELYREYPARYGTDPLLLVQIAIKKLSRGSAVLDVAGGQGRNGLYAAEQGHDVVLYDLSSIAVEQARDEAVRRGISSFRAMQGDVIRDGIRGAYDLIICAFLLHYYSRTSGEKLLKEMQKYTVAGGYHAIAVIMTGGDFYEMDTHAADHWYFAPGELKNAYKAKGWAIAWTIELPGTSPTKKNDGSPIQNKNAFVLAQAPQGNF